MRSTTKSHQNNEFPVDHYSASMWRKFCTSPVLAKIKYVMHEVIDSTTPATFVLGSAFHKAMEVYYGGSDTAVITSEEEAIEYGMKAGMEYIEMMPEGFIKWNKTYTNKQQLFDKFTFAFNSYVSERPYVPGSVFSTEEHLKERVTVEWNGQKIDLPVMLEGYTDRIDIDANEDLTVVDYKVVKSFSPEDKIDGAKMIASVMYYFLCYARHGRAPKKMRYEEVKTSKNKDGSNQVKLYEIIYEENHMFFDLFFRMYQDITDHLNGKAVSLPNLDAMFDGDIELIAYINRLDVEEVKAEKMKMAQVDNITDLLKSEIANASSMKSLMAMVEKEFVSAKSLNYDKMSNEDKIQTKMIEHGMMLRFDSLINGATVDLYRFTPSIGIKMSRLKSYTADVEQVLGRSNVRILAPIPGTSFVGVEVPREDRVFPENPGANGFDIAIGQDVNGETLRFDLRKAPHTLIGGASGAGKSVLLCSIVEQLSKISKVDLHLFDPKMVELNHFESVANEYQCEHQEILKSLMRLVKTMNDRYKKFAAAGARNIEEYGGSMKYKFVVIDEFGDLPGKEIQTQILKLAQKARAAGIHIILTTQSPRVQIVTGAIKANFPVKIALRTAKAIDSIVLLDEPGAEKLVGKGDMIFSSDDGIVRLQGFKN